RELGHRILRVLPAGPREPHRRDRGLLPRPAQDDPGGRDPRCLRRLLRALLRAARHLEPDRRLPLHLHRRRLRVQALVTEEGHALYSTAVYSTAPKSSGMAASNSEQQRRMPAAPIAAPQAAAAQPATPPSAAQHPAAS